MNLARIASYLFWHSLTNESRQLCFVALACLTMVILTKTDALLVTWVLKMNLLLIKKLFILLQSNLRIIVEMANDYIANDFCASQFLSNDGVKCLASSTQDNVS